MLKKHGDIGAAVIFILPSLVLITVFSAVPAMMNLYFSFTSYQVMKPPEWIGLANYQRIFKDPYFLVSIKNTFVYLVFTVPLQTGLSLLMAVLLAEFFRKNYGEFIRSALFIPVIASAILVGTLWTLMLSSQGPVNKLITLFALPPVNWLGDKRNAMISVVMVSVWKNAGYYLVIYYAGILDIPVSYYEAARVDGAGGLQRFWYITLPCVKRITFLILTLGTIWSFQVFDLVYIMTMGGPGMSTITLVYTIYTAGFREFKMGYASAISMLMLCFVLVFSLIQRVALKEE